MEFAVVWAVFVGVGGGAGVRADLLQDLLPQAHQQAHRPPRRGPGLCGMFGSVGPPAAPAAPAVEIIVPRHCRDGRGGGGSHGVAGCEEKAPTCLSHGCWGHLHRCLPHITLSCTPSPIPLPFTHVSASPPGRVQETELTASHGSCGTRTPRTPVSLTRARQWQAPHLAHPCGMLPATGLLTTCCFGAGCRGPPTTALP